MGVAPALLSRRAAAFAALAVAVVAWFALVPHLGPIGLWPAIALVSVAVIPGTLLLVLVALPAWRWRRCWAAAVACALLTFAFTEIGWGLPANFAKLWAAVFAGWAFVQLFEMLSWVVLVACIVPVVDAFSVWQGPTHAITAHHFEIYTTVAIAFLVPGGAAAYLGPPDILFFALFLAAAARWGLRVVPTWIATAGMYGLTVVIANATHAGGLPALPFLSAGFLAVNADLCWRAIRRSADSPAS